MFKNVLNKLKKFWNKKGCFRTKSFCNPSSFFIEKRIIAIFVLFGILASFFSLTLSSGTYAATIDDLSGRTLAEGKWVPSASSEANKDFMQDKVNKFMYEKAELKIDKNGKVTGGTKSTFDDIEWLKSGLMYTGEAELILNGDYNAKENTMSGRFEIKQTASNSKTASSLTWDAKGSFKGSRAIDIGLVLKFSGEENWTIEPNNASGSRNLSYEAYFDDDASNLTTEEGSCFGWKDVDISSSGQSPLNDSKARSDVSFPLIPIANAIDSGARFTYFSGEVTVTHQNDPNKDTERFAEQDLVLDQGDTIETQSDSCAIIGFADMTTFIMKSYSRIILEPAPEKQSKISLLNGKIWANVKRMYKDGSMDVTMNQAVAGIKGTTFVAEDDGTTSTLKVIEGSVEYTSNATGEKTMVEGGQMAVATKDGLSKTTTFDIEKESVEWDQIKKNASGKTDKSQSTTASGIPAIGIVVVLVSVMATSLAFLRRRMKGRS